MKKSPKRALKWLLALALIVAALLGVPYLLTRGIYAVPKTVAEDPTLPRVTINGDLFHAEAFGDPARPVVIVVHGGPGWDYRSLLPLKELADEYRVVCPDVPGRGLSGWLKNPMEYQVPTYLADMVTLLARLDADSVHWVGTSMGGLIGMTLASLPETPLRKLVLNDVGPVIPAASLARIGEYLGKAPQFPDFAAATQYIRAVSSTFGKHSDEQWALLT